RSNPIVDQKLVMAHVYAHNDFFKNNSYFAHTNRNMIDQMAKNASQVRSIIDQEGENTVEIFIDCCLSLENLIDIHPRIKSHKKNVFKSDKSEMELNSIGRFPSKPHLESFVNPPDVIKNEIQYQQMQNNKPIQFPEEPQRDILQFLLDHAPLKGWQHDILEIIREEACYFAPQGQTKIINEGWASYWHSTIMTRHCLDSSEIIDYADRHSGAMASPDGQLNPYKLGIELLRDIEMRWNLGQFGKEWEECDDRDKHAKWNLNTGLGQKKLFETRRIHNDITLIDEFLTPEFCHRHKLFSFGLNEDTATYEVESREFPMIKKRLLFSLTNFGQPVIHVIDGNYLNLSELYLQHKTIGSLGLRMDYAQIALENLHKIWQKPVHIETMDGESPILLSFDGISHRETSLNSDLPKAEPQKIYRRDG
ncbi:MAG: SpoVR family protein, partial [bacterium]